MKEKNPSESHGHVPLPLAVQDGKGLKKRARAVVVDEEEQHPEPEEHIFHSKPQLKKSKKAEPVPVQPQEEVEEEEVKKVPNNGERLNAILRERRDAQFQNIKEALSCYLNEHGHTRMSRQYKIPEDPNFYPEKLWGMQLGNRFRDIKRGTCFRHHRHQLEEAGFDCNTHPELKHTARQRYPFEVIKAAFLAYKEINSDLLVPNKFKVEEGNMGYPKETWGMPLGAMTMTIRNGLSLKRHRDELEAIGFNYEDQRMKYGHEAILGAIQYYKDLNEGSIKIPKAFEVPFGKNTEWPEAYHNMKLGNVLHGIRNGFTYKDHKAAFEALGITIRPSWKKDSKQKESKPKKPKKEPTTAGAPYNGYGASFGIGGTTSSSSSSSSSSSGGAAAAAASSSSSSSSSRAPGAVQASIPASAAGQSGLSAITFPVGAGSVPPAAGPSHQSKARKQSKAEATAARASTGTSLESQEKGGDAAGAESLKRGASASVHPVAIKKSRKEAAAAAAASTIQPLALPTTAAKSVAPAALPVAAEGTSAAAPLKVKKQSKDKEKGQDSLFKTNASVTVPAALAAAPSSSSSSSSSKASASPKSAAAAATSTDKTEKVTEKTAEKAEKKQKAVAAKAATAAAQAAIAATTIPSTTAPAESAPTESAPSSSAAASAGTSPRAAAASADEPTDPSGSTNMFARLITSFSKGVTGVTSKK